MNVELPETLAIVELIVYKSNGFARDITDVNYRLFVKPAPTSIVINLPDSILKVRKQYIQMKKEYFNLIIVGTI